MGLHARGSLAAISAYCALLALVPACDLVGNGDECAEDGDCSGDDVCDSGECVECENDNDCDDDEECDDGDCEAASVGEGEGEEGEGEEGEGEEGEGEEGEGECAVDLDCQILNGSAGDECFVRGDCPDPEIETCVEAFAGGGVCLIADDDGETCTLVEGFESVSLPDLDGFEVQACVADTGICDSGSCIE